MTISSAHCRVRVGTLKMRPFKVVIGLIQRDALSSVLFNVALERIIRNRGLKRKVLLFYKCHQYLAFADDVTLITR